MPSTDAGLPQRVQIGPNWTVPVSVLALPLDLYGQWVLEDGEGEVFINSRVSRMQKHLTLFHELFHVAEDKLYFSGAIRHRSSEERVRHMALTLFGILATSGLWAGVSAKEARRFYARMTRQYERHASSPARRRRPIRSEAARRRKPQPTSGVGSKMRSSQAKRRRAA